MKKLAAIAFLIAAVLLCACTVANNVETTQPTTEVEPAQTETPLPEPTPIPELTKIELLVDIPLNTRVLNETETEGVYSVALHEEEEERPAVPTYTWYINGADADTIDEVVLEFDVFDTVRPLDGKYYGYDQAFYIILHNFDTIPGVPPGSADRMIYRRGDIDRNIMLKTPELGVDLKKYAEWEGEHVRISIPYSEFQTALRDLALQFLPGTTFGNLHIYLWGENGLYADTVQVVTQRVEYPERDLMTDVIEPIFTGGMEPFPMVDDIGHELGNRIHGNNNGLNITKEGLAINADGSVNMPVSFYDLGEYKNEVQGKYAVVPEGIAPALAVLGGFGCFSEEQQRQVVNFVVKQMMNENGQFYGVYDIKQQKMVATDRKAAALPILSELAGYMNYNAGPDVNYKFVSNQVVDLIANSMIANDILRVGDKLYYAPYGIDENGVMELKLSDFAISPALLGLMNQYSLDGSRLREEYGCATLLEGISNSLKLILEGQEQNETRLPSEELTVLFSADGESYELQPSDTFNINNSYFSIGLFGYIGFSNAINDFAFYKTGFNESIDHTVMRLAKVKDGAYTQSQVREIRKIESRFAEMTNAYEICDTLYESWLDVYNFLKVQTSDTIYANAYNVHTGEIVEATVEVSYSSFGWFPPFTEHFGTTATSMNYYLLVGIFNDEAMARESGHLTLVNLDAFVQILEGTSRTLGASNPDMYAAIGFDIWGFDSLRYAGGNWSIGMDTYPLHYAAGANLTRENWKVFTMRKINQFTEDEDNYLTPDDPFPTFYDHIPAVMIVS